jgi:predicted nucleic acid-binding protein
MAVQFVDTNIFLRLLTEDDPTKAARCRKLFERALAGSVQLATSELVIAEIVWTLLSYYALPKRDVIEKVGQILNTPNLVVGGGDTLLEALVLWGRCDCDFIDAYNAARMRHDGLAELFSYDTDFDALPFLRRLEP